LEVAGALGILLRTFGMLSTVKFNHDLRLQAEKVHNVTTDHLLAAEFAAFQLAIPESSPEHFFSVG
jgi:hypothetical protein